MRKSIKNVCEGTTLEAYMVMTDDERAAFDGDNPGGVSMTKMHK